MIGDLGILDTYKYSKFITERFVTFGTPLWTKLFARKTMRDNID
jgi:hypothetical protein